MTTILNLDQNVDLSNWGVPCAITGEMIPLTQLKYWDVEKQEVYSRPELVPANAAAISKLDSQSQTATSGLEESQ